MIEYYWKNIVLSWSVKSYNEIIHSLMKIFRHSKVMIILEWYNPSKKYLPIRPSLMVNLCLGWSLMKWNTSSEFSFQSLTAEISRAIMIWLRFLKWPSITDGSAIGAYFHSVGGNFEESAYFPK